VLTAVLGAGGFAAWMAVGPARQTITEGRTGGTGGPVTNGTGGTEVPRSPVPEHYAAVQGSPVVPLPDGRRAPEQIVRSFGGESVIFQLVRPGDSTIAPFYMMRDKCWERLLKTYEARPDPLSYRREPIESPDLAVLGVLAPTAVGFGHGLLPAFRVGVDDAERICQWLGGSLPTAQQWDAAGGFYEMPPHSKPFLGFDYIPRQGEMRLGGRGLHGLLRLRTSVGDRYQAGEFGLRAPGVGWRGPLPVGMATRDVSWFGCRDMAANGQEWTKSVWRGEGTIAFEDRDGNPGVALRGKSYTNRWPLTFGEVEAGVSRFDEELKGPTRDAYITFRAALKIPAAR
jgi:formylglycine-generating enzyme required for sulfatase activity